MEDTYTEGQDIKPRKNNLNSGISKSNCMIRISIYHWLPIADTVLAEIEKRLRALPPTRISQVEVERDAVSYFTVFHFSRDFRSHAVFPIHGKINQRGFCQHVLNIAPLPGVQLNSLLNEIVPAFRQQIAGLLYVLAPDAVRNKLAILQARITPFQQFQSVTLDPPLEDAVRELLYNLQVTAIMLDQTHADVMRAGFAIPDLAIQVDGHNADSSACANENGDCFLFYSNEYHPDEWATHDSVIYKYCALVLYVRFLDHTISLLKETRDYLFAPRRRLAFALQGNLSEHFEMLTQIKRYLTYVNIKLPMVQKVILHLQTTREAETFAAKIATFDEPANVYSYPALRNIETTLWQPHYLIERITHDADHLQELFDEDAQEIQIISSEISQVLEGSLLSEHLQISTRALEATQATLEIQRSAKTLANTNKWMTVLLLAVLGALIAMGFGAGVDWAVGIGIVLLLVGYLVTQFAQRRHMANFRMVIPVHAHLPADALNAWLASHQVVKYETNEYQSTCGWQAQLPVRVLDRSRKQTQVKQHTFHVTVELLRHGFLHSITLEKEHSRVLFYPIDLVQAIFGELRANGCLTELEESSLYANALSQLEIPLDTDLPALNKLLTLPSTQVNQIVNTGAAAQEDSLSRHDLQTIQDLNTQPRAYREWLQTMLTDSTKQDLVSLLGLRNVHQKLKLLERLEEAHANGTEYVR